MEGGYSGQRGPLCRHKDLTTEALWGLGQTDGWSCVTIHGDRGSCQELPHSPSLVEMGGGVAHRKQVSKGNWTEGGAPHTRSRLPEPEPAPPLPSPPLEACFLPLNPLRFLLQ